MQVPSVDFFPFGRVSDSVTVLYHHFRLCSVKFISSFIPHLHHTAASPSDAFHDCLKQRYYLKSIRGITLS